MGAFTIPDPSQQDPTQFQPWLPNSAPYAPNGIYGYSGNPYGGWDPNANNGQGNGPDTSQMGFAPHGNEADVDPNASMEKIYAANRDTINTTGNVIGQEAGNQLNYYSPLQQQYQGAQNQALNKLQQTPGYTPGEASKIGVDYSQFNSTPQDFVAEAGDPNAAAQTMNAGVGNEQDALGRYQSGLTGNLGDYEKNLGGNMSQAQGWEGSAADQYGQGVSGAAQGLQSGLQDAQQFGKLDSAVNDKSLGFDPNGTEKQMSDADVQNLVTSAGTTVGNRYRTAEDTLERQAAAAGNSNPLALAAARQQLLTQESADAGDVMTQAQIDANNAQYGRASGIEGQRLGAATSQAGMRANAATTEQAQGQSAAALGGTQNIAAQQAIGANRQSAANLAGQQGIDAANQYGQFATGQQGTAGQFGVGQQNTQTGQQYTAAANADAAATARAKSIADQKYSQGTGSAAQTSQGQQTLGNARIAGEGAYRSGVAGQQQLAQQGGQAAQQVQLGAYGTQTSGSNAAAGGQANFEVGKPSLGDSLGKGLAQGVANLFAKGGVADEPMVAKVAESGPEWVGPMNATMMETVRGAGRYRSHREHPEMFGVAA